MPDQSSWAISPCVWVGKAHVPKHKLRTGPWVILTGNRPLCMGGCKVRGIFLACMRSHGGSHSPTGRVFLSCSLLIIMLFVFKLPLIYFQPDTTCTVFRCFFLFFTTLFPMVVLASFAFYV
jgi:hypothetical protein